MTPVTADLERLSRLPADAETRLSQVIISPEASISAAVEQLDQAGTGALVLCRPDRHLCGLLTDGDFRRAVLRGVSMAEPCLTIATRDPVVATPNDTPADLLLIMNRFDVNQIPIVNPENVVVAFAIRGDLVDEDSLAPSAVIMAGGYGKRLFPLTESLPKPMLPVGDRPLLERTIHQLRDGGIRRVNVTTHYLAEKISDHFGDGTAFGVDLNYVREDTPLGTAGGLRLLQQSKEPLLVINGDILTSVDFRHFLAFHREQKADLTVAVRTFETKVPYGVVECDGPHVRKLVEKPIARFLVNAGIYMLEPSVYRYIPNNVSFNMTDLIDRLLKAGRPVVSFPVVEYWLDIGQHADYEKAQEDFKTGRLRE